MHEIRRSRRRRSHERTRLLVMRDFVKVNNIDKGLKGVQRSELLRRVEILRLELGQLQCIQGVKVSPAEEFKA